MLILPFKEQCNLIDWEDGAYQNDFNVSIYHCIILLIFKMPDSVEKSKQSILLLKILSFEEFYNLIDWKDGPKWEKKISV